MQINMRNVFPDTYILYWNPVLNPIGSKQFWIKAFISALCFTIEFINGDN